MKSFNCINSSKNTNSYESYVNMRSNFNKLEHVLTFNESTKSYILFDSVNELIKYNINNKQVLHEVIFGNLPHRIHFDIDYVENFEDDNTSLNGFNEFNEFDNTFISSFTKLILFTFSIMYCGSNKSIQESDILICSSCGLVDDKKFKYSYHIIIKKYYVENNDELNEFYNKIKIHSTYVITDEVLRAKIIDSIDKGCTTSVHNLRLLGYSKNGTNRIKKTRDHIIYSDSLIQYSRDKIKQNELLYLTDENGNRINDNTSKQIINNKVKIDDKLVSDILKLFKDYLQGQQFYKRKNNIIGLKRITPSYCHVCKDEHESNANYIIVNENTGIAVLSCHRIKHHTDSKTISIRYNDIKLEEFGLNETYFNEETNSNIEIISEYDSINSNNYNNYNDYNSSIKEPANKKQKNNNNNMGNSSNNSVVDSNSSSIKDNEINSLIKKVNKVNKEIIYKETVDFGENYGCYKLNQNFMNLLDYNLARKYRNVSKNTFLDYKQNFFSTIKNKNIYNDKELKNYEFCNTLCIKAAMKMGKTKKLKEYLETYFNAKNTFKQVVIFLAFRQTFANEIYSKTKELGFKLYSDIKGEINLNKNNKIIIQMESLHRILVKNIINIDLLIMDESESIFEQFGSGKFKNLNLSFNIFHKIFTESNKLICMDANLTNRTYNLIKTYRFNNDEAQFNENVYYHENSYKNCTDDKYYFLEDKVTMYSVLDSKLKQNKKIVIVSNSLKEIKNLEIYISTNNPTIKDKIKTYSSETSYSEKVEHFSDVSKHWKFITKKGVPNTESNSNSNNNGNSTIPISVLIYSPTVSAGVSFEEPYYDLMFGYFTDKSCTVESCRQMMGRIRILNDKEYYIYINSKSTVDYPIDEESISNYYKYNLNNLTNKFDDLNNEGINSDYINNEIIINKNNFYKLWVQNKINTFLSINDFKNRFIRQIHEFGSSCYNLALMNEELILSIKLMLKESSALSVEKETTLILNQRLITTSEYSEIIEKENSKPEEITIVDIYSKKKYEFINSYNLTGDEEIFKKITIIKRVPETIVDIENENSEDEESVLPLTITQESREDESDNENVNNNNVNVNNVNNVNDNNGIIPQGIINHRYKEEIINSYSIECISFFDKYNDPVKIRNYKLLSNLLSNETIEQSLELLKEKELDKVKKAQEYIDKNVIAKEITSIKFNYNKCKIINDCLIAVGFNSIVDFKTTLVYSEVLMNFMKYIHNLTTIANNIKLLFNTGVYYYNNENVDSLISKEIKDNNGVELEEYVLETIEQILLDAEMNNKKRHKRKLVNVMNNVNNYGDKKLRENLSYNISDYCGLLMKWFNNFTRMVLNTTGSKLKVSKVIKNRKYEYSEINLVNNDYIITREELKFEDKPIIKDLTLIEV